MPICKLAMSLPKRPADRLILAATVMCWLVAVALGLGKVWAYANTPGQAADAPMGWPADSTLARDAARPTLVMLVHPQCSCSQASMGELEKLMAHVQGQVTAHVLFYRPAGAGPEWTATDLWRIASSIPGVTVSVDDDGEESARFGGFVSGQTFLFGTDNRLAFSGGITFARGHAGDNAGRSSLQALIRGRGPASAHTPVFGCALGRPRLS
jgi:hypothetical protein